MTSNVWINRLGNQENHKDAEDTKEGNEVLLFLLCVFVVFRKANKNTRRLNGILILAVHK